QQLARGFLKRFAPRARFTGHLRPGPIDDGAPTGHRPMLDGGAPNRKSHLRAVVGRQPLPTYHGKIAAMPAMSRRDGYRPRPLLAPQRHRRSATVADDGRAPPRGATAG